MLRLVTRANAVRPYGRGSVLFLCGVKHLHLERIFLLGDSSNRTPAVFDCMRSRGFLDQEALAGNNYFLELFISNGYCLGIYAGS